ncbi:MAG: ROK family protein [Polyangiaceae bacterium]|jgi:polyphosphate glucokinase
MASVRKPSRRPTTRRARAPLTLVIDIGGSGIKALVLDFRGEAVTERVRLDTPRPATPKALLDAIRRLIEPLGPFDRVSVGFPGVVSNGITRTAPNLDPSWQGINLARRIERVLGRPARVVNDAGVQGFGTIRGQGLEMVLTLGTGLGCALFYRGTYIPNLELAHHPFRKGLTYEDYLGDAALRRDGKRKWNGHLTRALVQIQATWNPDRIYVGGGNARLVTGPLPANARITSNIAGLLGGIALWQNPLSEGFVESLSGATRKRK